MADEALGGSGGGSLADDILRRVRENRIADLASRASFGDESASQEAKANDGNSLLASARDIAAPFAGGVASSVGSLLHAGSSVLNAAGLSNNSDPNSFASTLDRAGESARSAGHAAEDWASDEKKVRDQANALQAQRLAEGGDYVGAAAKVAGYKTKHALETASELAGGLAVPVALGAATGGLGAAAGLGAEASSAASIAARVAGFSGSTSGNTGYDVYKKYKEANPQALAALNPEFAANPTADNQDRIARAAATKAGLIDAGINGVLTEIGPAGKFIRSTLGDAVEGVAKAGLANVQGGGITAAAKMAASNPFASYGAAVAKDTALFAGQAAGSQINQNVADMGVDANANLGQGVAEAVGGAIPAAVGLGLKNRAGERANAKSAMESIDSHAPAIADFAARSGLPLDAAIGRYMDSRPELSGVHEADALAIHSRLADTVKPEAIDAARDSARDQVLSGAEDAVVEGKAPDMKSAVDAARKADADMAIHNDIYDAASKMAGDEKFAKNIEARQAKSEQERLDNGKAVAEDYAKAKGESDLSFEDFAANPDSQLNDKAKANYQEFATKQAAKLYEAVGKAQAAHDSLMAEIEAKKGPKSKPADPEKLVDKAVKEAGIQKGGDVDPEAVRKALLDKIQGKKDAAEEKAATEAVAKESNAERNRLNAEQDARVAAREKQLKAKEEARLAEEPAKVDPELANQLGDAIKTGELNRQLTEAMQEGNRSADKNVMKERSVEAESRLATAANEATRKGFEEVAKSVKGFVKPEKVDAFRRQLIEREATAKGNDKAREKLAENAKDAAEKSKIEKDIDAVRETKVFSDALRSLDQLHVDMQAHFEKSKDVRDDPKFFDYDHKKNPPSVKKAVAELLQKTFPGNTPESRAGRHAMHVVLGKHWTALNNGVSPAKARKAENEARTSRGEPKVFRIDESSRHFNGNIHASEKITPEEITKVLQQLSNVPLEKLAKFIKVSKSYEDAFAHDAEMLADLRSRAKAESVKGMYDPETGIVHVFADAATDKLDVAKTIVHEINHRGLAVLMTELDHKTLAALSQKLLNGNSYVRKLVSQLEAGGNIPRNASAHVKLAEALAYMAEDLHSLRTNMARGTLTRIVQELRGFIHSIVSKVFGQEAADKLVPHMSDANVVDVVRMVTAKGLQSLEDAKGTRYTTIERGQAETNYLLRQTADEVSSWGKRAEALQDSVKDASKDWFKPISGIANAFANAAVTLTHERDHGAVRPALEGLRSSRTKADQDKTGKLREGLGIAELAHRLEAAGRYAAGKNLDNINLVNHIDGGIGGMAKEVGSAAKWMLDSSQQRYAKFIGERLQGIDADGHPKYFQPSEIHAMLAQHGAAHGIKAEEFQSVATKYESLINGTRHAREIEAKGNLIDAMETIRSAFGGAAAPHVEKAIIRAEAMHSRSISEIKDAFDAVVKAVRDNGDYAELRSNKKALDRLEKSVAAEMDNYDIARKSGYIPQYREGKHFTRVLEKTMENGVEKWSTIDRKQTDSQGEAHKHFRDAKALYKEREAKGEIKIEKGTVAEGKGRLDEGNTLSAMLESLQNNKDVTPEQREAAMLALSKDALGNLADELADKNNIEKNGRKPITGYDINAERSAVKAIESMTARGSRAATRQRMTNFLLETTRGEHAGNGLLQDRARKLVENFDTPDKKFVNHIKGFTYLAYLGGSPASALLQHFQQYVLAAPVMSQYLEGGGLKAQAAIAKASFDIYRGLDSLKDPAERQMIEQAIASGYIQHPALVQAAAQASNALGEQVKALGALSRAAGVMMSTVEYNNRVSTLLAAHRLFRDKIGEDGSFDLTLKKGDRHLGAFLKDGDAGIGSKPFATFLDFAHHVVSEAHFDPSRFNKADIERGVLGSLMMQFKMFPIHMLQTAMRLPTKQRLEVLGALAVLSGAGGMPFMSNIEDLIDAGSEWLGHPINSKRARVEAIEEAVGRNGVSDFLNNGISTPFGLDFGQRIGVGDIVPFLGALRPSNQHRADDIAKSFGASFSYANSMFNALASAAKGDFRGAALGVAPSAIGNLAKGVEMAATGVQRNAAGEIVRKDVGLGEAAARALGFNSAASADVSRAKDFNRQEEEQHSMISQKYAKAYARAAFEGDSAGVQEAMDAVQSWNREHIGTPMMIRPDAIRDAVKKYQEGHNGNLDEIDRQIRHSTGAQKQWWISQRNAIKGMG